MRRWGSPSEEINTWWERLPVERYWLDVTNRNDRHTHLAAPRGDSRSSGSWNHQLIRHVRSGDLVFHFDAMQEAIVAWSIAHGPVEKTDLPWPLPVAFAGDDVTSRSLPSWAIHLRQSTAMDPVVPLREIARTQWSLFPALCALESEVGDPLYYPFDMGNRDATRLLSGHVFKLPEVFVQGIPGLAFAARHAIPTPIAMRVPVPVGRAGASPARGLMIEHDDSLVGSVMQGSA